MAMNEHKTFQQATAHKQPHFPRAANRMQHISRSAIHPTIPLQFQLAPQQLLHAQSVIGNRAVVQLLRQQGRDTQTTNNTHLPEPLKTNMESLSGVDLSNVKIHHNSEKPLQLNALAYAQGSNIYLGAGQERHLPHEAWHVVQQKQGRVKPTLQMKTGIGINDDATLEKEATQWGEKAKHCTPDEDLSLPRRKVVGDSQVVQRRVTKFKPDQSDSKNTIAGVLQELRADSNDYLNQIYEPTVDIKKNDKQVIRAKQVTATIAPPFLEGERGHTTTDYKNVKELGKWEHLASTSTLDRKLDTGHLIADTFFLDTGDTFVKANSYVAENLAPQDTSENTGTYKSKETEIKTRLLAEENKNEKFNKKIKEINEKFNKKIKEINENIGKRAKNITNNDKEKIENYIGERLIYGYNKSDIEKIIKGETTIYDASGKSIKIDDKNRLKIKEEALRHSLTAEVLNKEEYKDIHNTKFFEIKVNVSYLPTPKFSLETLLERNALKIIDKKKHEEFKNKKPDKSEHSDETETNNRDQMQIDGNHLINNMDVEEIVKDTKNEESIKYNDPIYVPSRIPTKWTMTITKEGNDNVYDTNEKKLTEFYENENHFYNYEKEQPLLLYDPEAEKSILETIFKKYSRYTSKQIKELQQLSDYSKNYKALLEASGTSEQDLALFQQALINIITSKTSTFEEEFDAKLTSDENTFAETLETNRKDKKRKVERYG
ncbi:eCIS core domain-containing protein [Candidatus Regiella insecticola]|uniref:eCIS core domain-containing protein n=1 Tax=Candidatus Regiella insecticola TaxID=138073 RepID=UPI0002F994E3|nr:DUF4157 domain-containing protein [Candidatus Regiella insecticola]